MTKRNIVHKDVFLALTLATLVFILGVFFGNIFVSDKYDSVSDMNYNLQIETSAMELQYDLIQNEPCKVNDTSYLRDQMQLLGDRLTYLEGIYGKSSEKIEVLKSRYSQLQIRHWLLQKHLVEFCNTSDTTILYFYSNKDCSECENQGTVLTAYKEISDANINIYSFDVGINDILIQTLTEIYSISEVPSVVFNEELFNGYMSLDQLKRLK